MLGAWVSGVIQDRSKTNEITRAAQEARLQSQNAAVNKLLTLLGAFFSASDDLLVTVNDAYGETGRPAHEVDALRKWKAGIAERRDAADSDWRREKRSLGFVFHDVFEGNAMIDQTWREVVRTADEFEQCTREWFTANAAKLTSLKADDICPEPRAALERAVETFTTAANAVRRISVTQTGR